MSQSENQDHNGIKIVFLGDTKCGKSSLIRKSLSADMVRFKSKNNKYRPTILDTYEKTFHHKGWFWIYLSGSFIHHQHQNPENRF